MKVLLLNPRWAFVANDLAGSGIPYWPISLSIFKTALDNYHDVHLEDLVVEDIENFDVRGKVLLQGKNPESLTRGYLKGFEIVIVYAMNFAGHEETLRTIDCIRQKFSGQIMVLQNTQAVTGYGFNTLIIQQFKSSGADGVLTGNPQSAISSFLGTAQENFSNKEIYYGTSWTKKQIEGYNRLPFSHGPKDRTFVPILTSWGCPYGCDFCVVPSNNSRKWLYRKPSDVFDEMERYYLGFGISHFQIEDLNPTVDWPRWREIIRILRADGRFTYAIVSGTKAETIPLREVASLHESGCRYLSISPESGSERLMKIIGKHFDHGHGIKLINECSKNNIRSQACFLIGHPSENWTDKILTLIYILKLTLAGIDELAFFTIAPHPGSKLFDTKKITSTPNNLVTFSGHGRELNFKTRLWRKFLIFFYLLMKLIRPLKSFRAVKRMLQSKPETKTENIFARVIFIKKFSKNVE
jgi:anaerobic magnesium-protoporphyrin IX monomethyl ester cyclase